ncbi:hypothetical protein CAPTEDRAFT_205053 [Capitella teleta]|uniref:Transcription factor IIIC 90kDa subunit N-terminal domain-containing protein n=1 Tax=Capitella teleta TaxID=283909 RepID=R7TGP3_CAPTE|nr:hypothetical protein CAPTEDRAFT_205053 [Capitella teleta]|eukprot:ELT90275.1 hypothetical protein CAPTEDRAFT_205053 [Capitella teleta]
MGDEELPSMHTAGFKSKANRNGCFDVSPEGCIAVGTTEGLQVVLTYYSETPWDSHTMMIIVMIVMIVDWENFHSDSSLGNEAININKTIVTTALGGSAPLNLGFSKGEIQNGISGDDWFEIILDPDVHLNHPEMSEQGFRAIKWSPLGLDHNHRCVLAALGINTSLEMFSLNSTRSSWQKVVDLQAKWIDVVNEKGYFEGDVTFEGIKDKVSHRAFLSTPMALTWTPLYTSEDSSRASLLLVGLKSGHVATWRVKAPLTDQDDVGLAITCDTGCGLLSALQWCDQGLGEGFFVCGSLDGLARACFVDVNGGEVSVSSPVCLWSEKDNIPVSHIAWDKKRHVLVIAKGHCLLLYSLPPSTFNSKTPNDQLTEFVSIKTLRLTSQHPIADREQLDLKQMRLSVPEYNENKMPIPTWITNGFALSPNHTHLFILTRPAVLYDHLVERFPMKLQIIPTFSSLQEEVLRVAPNCEHFLSDIYVSVRYSVVCKEPLPQLELGSKDDLTKVPLGLLRVSWLIRHIRVTSNRPFSGEMTDENDIESKMLISELLYLEFLKKYLNQNLLLLKTLSDRAKVCLAVLKSFVKQNSGTNRCTEVKDIIQKAALEDKNDVVRPYFCVKK